MFQLTFSEQSMSEVNALDHADQLHLMEKLGSLSDEVLQGSGTQIGSFHREGKLFHRFRIDDLRIYFERNDDTLHCHYVLRKNTFNDFVVRFKLPISDEQVLEKDQSFWNYLENLAKKTDREQNPSKT